MNDYYFDRDECLYEMMNDALNDQYEDQEENNRLREYLDHPSLSAADRNGSMLR